MTPESLDDLEMHALVQLALDELLVEAARILQLSNILTNPAENNKQGL